MKTFTLVFTALMLVFITSSSAQPGSLDSNFSYNGKVNIPTGMAHAVVVLPDGKIVAGGTSSSGFTVIRYYQNGSLDKNFGVNGKAIVSLDSVVDDNIVYSLAVQANGKIVAAGTDGKNFVLARFNYNGSLDNGFGTAGKVITEFSGKEAGAGFVTIQPDNKIVVVGFAFIIHEDLSKVALARYNSDGSLDKSFGNEGKLAVFISASEQDFGTSVILQPGGKMVVIGFSYTCISPTCGNDFALFRITSNGTIDSSFGTNGYVFTDFGDYDVTTGAATQSDGRIVVSGYSNFHKYQALLARYTRNGKLDSSFGINGKVFSAFGGNDAAYALAIQPDDKIITAGASNITPNDYNNTYFTINRFNKNGSPDTSFGIKSRTVTYFKKNSADAASGVALKPNGKIIVVGHAAGNFAVARYNNNESIQTVTENIAYVNVDQNKLPVANIKAYPNPVKDVLHIEGIGDKQLISIINAEGKLFQKKIISTSSYNWNVKQLPAGIYYLVIEENVSTNTKSKNTTTIKFIKQQ